MRTKWDKCKGITIEKNYYEDCVGDRRVYRSENLIK